MQMSTCASDGQMRSQTAALLHHHHAPGPPLDGDFGVPESCAREQEDRGLARRRPGSGCWCCCCRRCCCCRSHLLHGTCPGSSSTRSFPRCHRQRGREPRSPVPHFELGALMPEIHRLKRQFPSPGPSNHQCQCQCLGWLSWPVVRHSLRLMRLPTGYYRNAGIPRPPVPAPSHRHTHTYTQLHRGRLLPPAHTSSLRDATCLRQQQRVLAGQLSRYWDSSLGLGLAQAAPAGSRLGLASHVAPVVEGLISNRPAASSSHRGQQR